MRATSFKAIIFVIALVLHGLDAFAEGKPKYAPYDHGYPQIIQETDYGTIISIEHLYKSLMLLRKYDYVKMYDNPNKMSINISINSLILKTSESSGKTIKIRLVKPSSVYINNKLYNGIEVYTFYRTLLNILNDMRAESACIGVGYEQFKVPAYEKRTIIEFNFREKVVTVDCFSNGPNDYERLYVLDIENIKESYFWGNIK